MAVLACAVCGGQFSGRSNRKYCGKACSRAAINEARYGDSKARGASLASERGECPECGVDFALAVERSCGGYRRRKYCSDRCRVNNSARRRRATEAGRAYYQSRVEGGHYADASRRMRARARATETVECPYCGELFERTVGARKMLCGAAACKGAYQLDSCHRRNARMRDATVEPFARVEVFERDNWMCGICGAEVSADAPPRSPMSASLDHIIPLARGGAHTRENTQCAHLVCNMRKSDSIDTGRVCA